MYKEKEYNHVPIYLLILFTLILVISVSIPPEEKFHYIDTPEFEARWHKNSELTQRELASTFSQSNILIGSGTIKFITRDKDEKLIIDVLSPSQTITYRFTFNGNRNLIYLSKTASWKAGDNVYFTGELIKSNNPLMGYLYMIGEIDLK